MTLELEPLGTPRVRVAGASRTDPDLFDTQVRIGASPGTKTQNPAPRKARTTLRMGWVLPLMRLSAVPWTASLNQEGPLERAASTRPKKEIPIA